MCFHIIIILKALVSFILICSSLSSRPQAAEAAAAAQAEAEAEAEQPPPQEEEEQEQPVVCWMLHVLICSDRTLLCLQSMSLSSLLSSLRTRSLRIDLG